MQTEKEAVLVTVSVPEESLAAALAEALLQERRAACCQTLGPIRSQYRWQGKVESASEWLLVVKTQRQHLAALESIVVDRHPYEVPEIVVTAIEAGHAAYLDWIRQETTGEHS